MNHQLSLLNDDAPALRLFIGLLPDRQVQKAIDGQRRRWRWQAGTRFPPARRLHLTMHFLGHVHPDRVTTLNQALADVPMHEMQLVLREPQRWQVAVLRADEHAELRALHGRLALQLGRLGLPMRCAWTPHVTLAREIGGAVPPASAQPVNWTVRQFALIWSKLSPGPEYEILARYGPGH
jgi:RNA 2',3'-cyclic 3'-phosphodiesterase